MNFELPWEMQVLRDTVRDFAARELAPLQRTIQWGETVTEESLRPAQAAVKELGLWLLDVPKEYGGSGLGLLERCLIEEEVAKVLVLPFGRNEIFGSSVGPILYQGTDEQKERFLFPALRGELRVCFAQTEPNAGSDPSAIETRAVRDGDSYVVSGTKRFISDANRADYAQVICRTSDPNGPDGGRGELSCVLVDLHAPGVQLTTQWPAIAGEGPWEIVFDGVRVSVGNRIGGEGQGFELAQRWLTTARVKSHGARPLGMAQRAQELALAYAGERVTFGQPLAERQGVQFMLADSEMQLRQARLLVYQTAWAADQGHDIRNESYMVKIVCSEMAERVVDRAMQIYGGMGMMKELPLEYWYRYLRTARVTEGANEVLRWRLARNLLRGPRAQ